MDDQNRKYYEMGYTIDEFAKTLHGQFLTEQMDYTCKTLRSTQWKIYAPSFGVEISISEAPKRKIAMLSLPVLNVCFEFSESTADQRGVFLQRFFKYFHKGGG